MFKELVIPFAVTLGSLVYSHACIAQNAKTDGFIAARCIGVYKTHADIFKEEGQAKDLKKAALYDSLANRFREFAGTKGQLSGEEMAQAMKMGIVSQTQYINSSNVEQYQKNVAICDNEAVKLKIAK